MGLFDLFRKKAQTSEDNCFSSLFSELKSIKKILRKQSILIERVEQAIQSQGKSPSTDSREALMELANAMFMLENSIKKVNSVESGIFEAMDMVWDRLDLALEKNSLKMIRSTGYRFDPAIHECIKREGEDDIVKQIVSPGFISKGRVIRAAKVIV